MKLTKKQDAALLEKHAGHELKRDILHRNPGYSEVPGNVICETCQMFLMAFEDPTTKQIKPFPLEALPARN